MSAQPDLLLYNVKKEPFLPDEPHFVFEIHNNPFAMKMDFMVFKQFNTWHACYNFLQIF